MTDLNAFGSFQSGFSLGDAMEQRKLQQQQIDLTRQKQDYEVQQDQLKQQKAKALEELSVEAFNNPEALKVVYGQNRELGESIAKERDKFNRTSAMAIGDVLNARPEQKPQIWNRSKAFLEARGINTSDLPEKYSPETEQFLKQKQTELKTWDDTFKTIETDRGLMMQSEKTGDIKDTGLGVYVKPPSTVVNVGAQQDFKNATTLRGEYLSNSKTFNAGREGYERVIASAKDPSPAGDIGLIYGFMKVNDPGSTVREGEFATAQNAGSIPERIRAQYNQALDGTRLTKSQRADFVDRSRKQYKQSEKSQQKMVGQYKNMAERNNLNPSDVIVDFNTTAEDPQVLDQFKNVPLNDIHAEIARRKGGVK